MIVLIKSIRIKTSHYISSCNPLIGLSKPQKIDFPIDIIQKANKDKNVCIYILYQA